MSTATEGFLSRIVPARFRSDVPLVPVVRLAGAIGIGSPLRPALTLASAAPLLERAFRLKRAREVAVVVNSPGGSPVQSHLIFRRIRQLAAEKDKHVTVFVEDVAASGGYMIACAGDEIVADPSSIVGSIGVVSASFGFTELIEKIGIERRVHTAGERKVMLDPFRPEREEDVERLKALQRDVHAMFKDLVRDRRGAAIAAHGDSLFTGEFWSGTAGLGLGLVDRIGDLRSVMHERYGAKVKLLPVQPQRGFLLRRMTPGGASWSTGLADEALAAVEARALWARFGL